MAPEGSHLLTEGIANQTTTRFLATTLFAEAQKNPTQRSHIFITKRNTLTIMAPERSHLLTEGIANQTTTRFLATTLFAEAQKNPTQRSHIFITKHNTLTIMAPEGSHLLTEGIANQTTTRFLATTLFAEAQKNPTPEESHLYNKAQHPYHNGPGGVTSSHRRHRESNNNPLSCHNPICRSTEESDSRGVTSL